MNSHDQIKKHILLTEGRREDLEYTTSPKSAKTAEAINKVLVELKSHESGVFTKLAKRYAFLKKWTEKLAQIKDETNIEATDRVLEYFDPTDEIYTRVLKTISMTYTVSKKTMQTPAPKFDAKSMIANLPEELMQATELISEDMLPEITQAIELIVQKYTTQGEPFEKKPALRVKHNESKEPITESNGVIERIKGLFAKFFRRYDQKLAKLEQLIA